MNYISTKEASKKWGISTRRVVMLAKNGRIDGATLMDNRWLIPDNVEKPIDTRTKGGKHLEYPSNHFIFPYVLACISSKNTIEMCSPEEKELYKLDLLYENAQFEDAFLLGTKLLNAKNQYVRIGALYVLPQICMYLHNFEAVHQYSILFFSSVQEVSQHKLEINLLRSVFEIELVNTSKAKLPVELQKISDYSENILPQALSIKFYLNLIDFAINGSVFDNTEVEITCEFIEKTGYFYCALFIRSYLALYYLSIGDKKNAIRNIKKSIDAAVSHNVLFSVSGLLFSMPDVEAIIEKEYPKEIYEKAKNFSTIFCNSRAKYSEYLGKASIPLYLTEDDKKLIYCCIKNYSVDEIAKEFGLSKSGANRRLSNLYKKYGVNSKAKLQKRLVIDAIDLDEKKNRNLGLK